MAEGGNNCNGECHEIYPAQDGHIKQRVGDERFLESKDQFCAAFYHVHEWGRRKYFCLDEDSCIIAKRTKDDIMKFAQEAKRFAEKAKNLDEEFATKFHEETKQFTAKELNISAGEGKEFVEKTKEFAAKSFDERAKKAAEKRNEAKQLAEEAKKATKKQKKAKQLAEEAQQLVEEAVQLAEEAKQLVKKAKKATYAWCKQAKTVVAVVKFEKDGKILYEARYTNCGEEEKQKHAEDFLKDDIENRELGKKVEANQEGTITLYLTYQPCNKSTSIGGTAITPKDKTCCETLTTIVNDKLPPGITLWVKAANTCRLSLIPENHPDDETLRQNAVAGIKMLMGIERVAVTWMEKDDWHYLLSLTNELENREDLEVHEGRLDLDKCVRSNTRRD
jgi:tRNA(Arg) A34 adenosine deaminase TadA